MRLLLTILLLCLWVPVLAQEVSNVRASLEGNNVIIQYDLSGPSGQSFKVEIFSSHNNYASPLRLVTGDVGEDISPGNNRRITWQAKQELRVFSGDVQFEVRSEALFQPLRVTSPNGGTYKGGKSLPITWMGGTSGERMSIDIIRDGRVYRSLGSVTNTGSYSWAIPKKMEKSDGYTVRLTPSSGDSPASSRPFTMKKKGSLIIPIAAVVVAGVVIAIIAGGDDGGGGGGGTGGGGDDTLPPPPDPPGG